MNYVHYTCNLYLSKVLLLTNPFIHVPATVIQMHIGLVYLGKIAICLRRLILQLLLICKSEDTRNHKSMVDVNAIVCSYCNR